MNTSAYNYDNDDDDDDECLCLVFEAIHQLRGDGGRLRRVLPRPALRGPGEDVSIYYVD